MSTFTMKASFNGDIRRVTVPTSSFASLRETIAGLFPAAGANFAIKYEDPEGELVTVTSQAELDQAIKDATAAKKTLRLVITTTASAAAPELKIPETPRGSEAGPTPAAATPAAEAKSAEAKNDGPKFPDCVELKRMALAFFTEPTVLAALPETLTGVVDAVMELAAKKEFLGYKGLVAKLLSAEAIKSHPSIQRLLPFLPQEAPCLEEKLKRIQASELVPVFGPIVKWLLSKLPCAVAMLPKLCETIQAIPWPVKCRMLCKLLKCLKCCCPCLFECCPMLQMALCMLKRCCRGAGRGCGPCGPQECGPKQAEEHEEGPGAFLPFLPMLMGMLGGQGGQMPPFPFPGMMGGFGGFPFPPPPPGAGGHPFFGGRHHGPHGFHGRRGPPPMCGRFFQCGPGGQQGAQGQEQPQAQAQQGNEPAVHQGIICDGCQASPIVGTRFKCTVCPDFDLCETCEAKGAHQGDHPLMKLKLPRNRGPHGGAGHHGGHGHGQGFHHWRRFNRGWGGGCPARTERGCGTEEQGCPREQTPAAPTPAADSKESPAPQAPAQPAAASGSSMPAGQPLAEKYAVQLAALESMGFTNRDLNIYMLERHMGNVQQVANWLLEKMRA